MVVSYEELSTQPGGMGLPPRVLTVLGVPTLSPRSAGASAPMAAKSMHIKTGTSELGDSVSNVEDLRAALLKTEGMQAFVPQLNVTDKWLVAANRWAQCGGLDEPLCCSKHGIHLRETLVMT